MKDKIIEDFKKACKSNTVTLDVNDLKGRFAGETEMKMAALIDMVPRNGYLILEDADTLRTSELNFDGGPKVVEQLLKAKKTTRPDINIIMRGLYDVAFFRRFPKASDSVTFMRETPRRTPSAPQHR